MLGFGALGEYALGEGPFEPRRAVGGQWDAQAVRKGLAVAIVAGSFTGFVPQPPAQAAPVFTQFSEPVAKPKTAIQVGFTNAPQPPRAQPYVFTSFGEPVAKTRLLEGFSNAPQPRFVQPYVFSAFNQPLPSRFLIDELPSTFFEPEPPAAPPFTGFCTFEGIIKARFNVALHAARWWQPIIIPPDTHDGVFVKKKRKKHERDAIDIELEEKAKRRAAIELAVYGPEVVYQPPAAAIPEAASYSPPNVEDLARVIMQAKAAEREAQRQAIEQDEEDILELILRDL